MLYILPDGVQGQFSRHIPPATPPQTIAYYIKTECVVKKDAVLVLGADATPIGKPG
jgi:hypothetical protein